MLPASHAGNAALLPKMCTILHVPQPRTLAETPITSQSSCSYGHPNAWRLSCNCRSARGLGRRWWCSLELTLTDNVVIDPKPKRTLLPVLVALFLVSYGLMTLLVLEQAKTIQAQRSLISNLFDDSMQLVHLKQLEQRNKAGKAQSHAQQKAQTPSPDATSKDPKQQMSKNRARMSAPLHLPRRSDDTPDVRRSPATI